MNKSLNQNKSDVKHHSAIYNDDKSSFYQTTWCQHKSICWRVSHSLCFKIQINSLWITLHYSFTSALWRPVRWWIGPKRSGPNASAWFNAAHISENRAYQRPASQWTRHKSQRELLKTMFLTWTLLIHHQYYPEYICCLLTFITSFSNHTQMTFQITEEQLRNNHWIKCVLCFCLVKVFLLTTRHYIKTQDDEHVLQIWLLLWGDVTEVSHFVEHSCIQNVWHTQQSSHRLIYDA